MDAIKWIAAATVLALAVGCSKTEAKSDSKPSSSAAAKTTAAPSAKSETKPAADAKKKGNKKKGVEKKGAEAKGQKAASNATAKKSEAKKMDAEVESLDCNDDLEGVAWCDDDAKLVFCSDGDWFALDCRSVESGAFCGHDLDSHEVGCWAAVEFEEDDDDHDDHDDDHDDDDDDHE